MMNAITTTSERVLKREGPPSVNEEDIVTLSGHVS
jgi:hypothetical protein